MKEKKNIDDLFKDGLQNFEATPSPAVWNQIQADLKKQTDDRKVIPLWWKLAGVAAVLALLLTVGDAIFNTDSSSLENTIVIEETPKELEKDQNPVLNKEAVVDINSLENKTETKRSNELKISEDIQENLINHSKANEDAIVLNAEAAPNKKTSTHQLIKKTAVPNTVTAKEAVAANSNIEGRNTIANNSNKKEDFKKDNPLFRDPALEVLGVDTKEEVTVAVEGKGVEKNSTVKTEEIRGSTSQDLLVKKEISETSQGEEAVAISEEKKEDVSKENKKSIFDVIEEEKEVAVAKTEETSSRNWEVTPNVGPVFYNSLSEGSSIDPTFADNSQSTDANISYGVQISYNINDRLSVRSGVSNVNLGYSTGEVELATAPIAVALKSVNFDGGARVLSAFDKGSLNNLPPTDSGDPLAFVTPKSGGGAAELIQNISYYEVPMELEYALLNKRFGVQMIGGFSTLFLGDNEVSVQDGEFKEVLGEANNLNSVSFTTNVGLGFNYKISKRIKFNIEPMFKYQLNPYSDSSVDFKPYYLGVYSGLSFKF